MTKQLITKTWAWSLAVVIVLATFPTRSAQVQADKVCVQYVGPNGIMNPGCDQIQDVWDVGHTVVVGHNCPNLDCEEYTFTGSCGECRTSYAENCTERQIPQGQNYPTVSISRRTGQCAANAGTPTSPGHICNIINCALVGKFCACPTQFSGTPTAANVVCDCGTYGTANP